MTPVIQKDVRYTAFPLVPLYFRTGIEQKIQLIEMQPVRLNIYDLAEQNWYLAWAGVGIYHSGVEIYNVEYAYGAYAPC